VSNDDIKDLLKIFIDSGIAEMELKRGDNSLRLRRSFGSAPTAEFVIPSMVAPSLPTHAPPIAPAPLAPAPPPVAPVLPQPVSNDIIVKSPIVGTYYDSPKPGDPAFVKVGDSVEPGTVLCIIESMKLMNEIECEVAGTVAAKLMENGRPVEYGEALFAIRPR
jgi:acetyl-CoA carboxylase biotin carboxyl carrier protein